MLAAARIAWPLGRVAAWPRHSAGSARGRPGENSRTCRKGGQWRAFSCLIDAYTSIAIQENRAMLDQDRFPILRMVRSIGRTRECQEKFRRGRRSGTHREEVVELQ